MSKINQYIPSFIDGEAKKFVKVIDELQDYKTTLLAEGLRLQNPILSSSGKWICRQLTDYGYHIPSNYPLVPLQMFLANAGLINSLRGTELGVELLVSTLTLGSVEITKSGEWLGRCLYLDSEYVGYIMGDLSTANQLYLDMFNEDNGVHYTIDVVTKFTTSIVNNIVKPTLTSELKRCFPASVTVELNIQSSGTSDYYYHPLLYPKRLE